MTTIEAAAPAVTPVPFVDLRPVFEEIGGEALARIGEVVERGDFVGGAAVEAFEGAWARYCGRDLAIGVANGTDALELALRALGIGPGDEVIVPANKFIATAEAVVDAGATPRFVDVDPSTLLVTADRVADAVGPRTAAVIPVHLYGQAADMDPINAIAAEHGLMVLEDAAQAIGAGYKGKRAGVLGHASAFSFYPSKNLGGFGDGGMITTDDPELASRMARLRVHGMEPKYYHSEVG
ncbi:MAG TPA: DegT/DnrJ/EryC1/StrS family aminotransferase, partial [Acidimicrobiales bacterium]|nr:DegT/DnrJ/EryC1/StrS family aminotransferase [Acidimicrobiales bacterium]